MIFNIQRYSTHDGPGIRTVIFLKGCSLGCLWCQNPESRHHQQQLLFDQRRCIKDCQLCTTDFPHIFSRTDFSQMSRGITIDRKVITDDEYRDLKTICPSEAIAVCGDELTLDEIMTVVDKDAAFYQRTKGGVTLSGGEPFMQPKLSQMLLTHCKIAHYHTAVETCLHTPWKNIATCLPQIDLFLADLKHTSDPIFKQWTQGSAKRVLTNFRKLAQANKSIIVRVPLIQGFNANKSAIKDIVNFVADEVSANEIHFLPYHTLGMHKYNLLNIPYFAPTEPLQDQDIIDFAMQYAKQKNLNAILRG